MRINEEQLKTTKTITCDRCSEPFNISRVGDSTIGIDKGLNVDIYHMCPECTKEVLGFLKKREGGVRYGKSNKM